MGSRLLIHLKEDENILNSSSQFPASWWPGNVSTHLEAGGVFVGGGPVYGSPTLCVLNVEVSIVFHQDPQSLVVALMAG